MNSNLNKFLLLTAIILTAIAAGLWYLNLNEDSNSGSEESEPSVIDQETEPTLPENANTFAVEADPSVSGTDLSLNLEISEFATSDIDAAQFAIMFDATEVEFKELDSESLNTFSVEDLGNNQSMLYIALSKTNVANPVFTLLDTNLESVTFTVSENDEENGGTYLLNTFGGEYELAEALEVVVTL